MPLPIVELPCACGCGGTTRTGKYLRGHGRRHPAQPGYKWCARCGAERPLADFGPNEKRKDGKQTYCRDHQRAAVNASAAIHGARHGREHRQRFRAEMIAAYGGRCACCGESEPVFLCLDHPNGVPDEHRNARHRSGRLSPDKLCALLKRQGWPQEYRLLCWNCNAAIAMLGVCPHVSRPPAG
jgi:hypothetical protein